MTDFKPCAFEGEQEKCPYHTPRDKHSKPPDLRCICDRSELFGEKFDPFCDGECVGGKK